MLPTPLQPGLPSPIAIPEGYNKIVIDLQDCFFTIPLNLEDKKQFAFSLPSKNLKQPYLQFQWKVLPQEMKKPFTNIIPNQPIILIISNSPKDFAFSKSKTFMPLRLGGCKQSHVAGPTYTGGLDNLQRNP